MISNKMCSFCFKYPYSLQVIALGFDEESARLALGQFSGSVQRAEEELLKAGGISITRIISHALLNNFSLG